MLQITVPASEFFNEATAEFITTKDQCLALEHSLVSLSKWESKWKKPFLSKDPMTKEELRDYVRCMTLTQNVDPNVYYALTAENYNAIETYIQDPMTATWFKDDNNRPTREIITSELIYYWMVAQSIPMECQKWHLNRLLTLIRICGIKNAPQKKMSRKEAASQQRALNQARRAKSHSRG